MRNSDRYIRFATARDWLDLTHGGRSDLDHGYGSCEPGLIGTDWFAMDALMMIELAEYLGVEEDAKAFRALYQRIRQAFRTFFLGRNHLLRGCTQGGYLLAATAELLDAEDLEAARAWILQDMEKHGGITWGTATTPIALHGLCRLGLEQEAVSFLCREDYPSIGYMNRCGATTVWERWDTILNDQFHPHQMNAFSHIGLATVGEWIIPTGWDQAHCSRLPQGAAGACNQQEDRVDQRVLSVFLRQDRPILELHRSGNGGRCGTANGLCRRNHFAAQGRGSSAM